MNSEVLSRMPDFTLLRLQRQVKIPHEVILTGHHSSPTRQDRVASRTRRVQIHAFAYHQASVEQTDGNPG
jgi:hypothetical protein